jgi:formamidopyrimidine-DNA glycosylase
MFVLGLICGALSTAAYGLHRPHEGCFSGERRLSHRLHLDESQHQVLENVTRRAHASESHTLKRVLTDPRLFSGIGNAYSDEILHHTRLSPMQLTRRLTDHETDRLFRAAGRVLTRSTSTRSGRRISARSPGA